MQVSTGVCIHQQLEVHNERVEFSNIAMMQEPEQAGSVFVFFISGHEPELAKGPETEPENSVFRLEPGPGLAKSRGMDQNLISPSLNWSRPK